MALSICYVLIYLLAWVNRSGCVWCCTFRRWLFIRRGKPNKPNVRNNPQSATLYLLQYRKVRKCAKLFRVGPREELQKPVSTRGGVIHVDDVLCIHCSFATELIAKREVDPVVEVGRHLYNCHSNIHSGVNYMLLVFCLKYLHNRSRGQPYVFVQNLLAMKP